MYLTSAYRTIIGRRYEAVFFPTEAWLDRGPCYPKDTGLPTVGGINGHKYLMRMKTDANMISGFLNDAGRDWTTPYQDIAIEFNTQAQDAALSPGDVAAGHTIKVNTVAKTTTYRSGSGTGAWVLRIPILVKKSDVITYSYDTAAGATIAVDTTTELLAVTDVAINNWLTKRIHFTLYDSTNALVSAETIKLAVLAYNSGTVDTGVQSDLWMKRSFKTTTTTDANGVVDVRYYGSEVSGDTVYIAVIRPNTSPTECFVWADTVK